MIYFCQPLTKSSKKDSNGRIGAFYHVVEVVGCVLLQPGWEVDPKEKEKGKGRGTES